MCECLPSSMSQQGTGFRNRPTGEERIEIIKVYVFFNISSPSFLVLLYNGKAQNKCNQVQQFTNTVFFCVCVCEQVR